MAVEQRAGWRRLSMLLVCAGSASQPGHRLVVPLRLGQKPGLIASNDMAVQRRLNQKSYPCKLGNYDNVQYHLEIEVGKSCSNASGQIFKVVPDTGSSDLWVPSKHCSSCKAGVLKFDSSLSCGAKLIGEQITFRYGDGTVATGTSFRDSVKIGNLAVEDQFMIQVNEINSATHMKSDGILGLAHHYASDESSKGRSFLATLFKQHPHLPQHFSFYLTGHIDEPSELVFGDADMASHAKESHFQYGKAYYMSSTDLWLTSVWSIGWSGTGVEVTFADRGTLGAPALIDSGSSLIVLAGNIYDTLISELKWRFTGCREMEDQHIISCDCPPANDLSRVPSLVINIINARDLQTALCMSPDEYILESMEDSASGSSCVPALQRGSDAQPVPIILGMTFMRSFYTTFDMKNHRIGFARSRQSALPGGATCSVDSQPLVRRAIWLASVLMAAYSVAFACYVLCAPKGSCDAGRKPEQREEFFRPDNRSGAERIAARQSDPA